MVVRKDFKDIESMVDDALSIDSDFGVTFVTKFENATSIIKYIFAFSPFIPFFIQLSDPSFDGYDKEFIISITNDDELFVEKFYRKDRYLTPDDGLIFVLPDCSDECIGHLYKYNDSFYVEVGFDDNESDGGNSECESNTDILLRSDVENEHSLDALLEFLSTLK